MNDKKPATLTSDLLARKGEAQPFSVNPAERMTPYLSAEGGGAHFGGPRFDASSTPEERAFPPEPEIILTPEELEEGEGRGKLIALIVGGILVAGGVLFALSFQSTDRGVAPVVSDLGTPAPLAADSASELRSTSVGNDTAPVLTPPQTSAPAVSETPAAAAAPTPPQTEAAVPAAAPPAPVAPKPTETQPTAMAAKPAPAAKPAIASGGSYVVQLLALRDEAAARTAWTALQKKHPSLAGHASDIERADLGDRGVFYRLRAAGFTNKAEAQTFCTKLKAAGQDCIVTPR